MSHFGVAMIACLWAYNGWFAISLVAGEVKNPQRNLFPLSLIVGVIAVIAMAYSACRTSVLSSFAARIGRGARAKTGSAWPPRWQDSPCGRLGARAGLTHHPDFHVPGTTNGNIMDSLASLLPAQAARRPVLREVPEKWSHASKRRGISIIGQGLWSAVLAASGSYVRRSSPIRHFTFWIFYAMTVAGVWVLRRKYPKGHASGSYKNVGLSSDAAHLCRGRDVVRAEHFDQQARRHVVNWLFGLIVASGIPAYYGWRRNATIGPREPNRSTGKSLHMFRLGHQAAACAAARGTFPGDSPDRAAL